MRRQFESVFAVILAIATVAILAVSIQGCNTDQSPRAQFNDAQITTQVKSKLASDVNASSLTNINVNTTNGVVTLAGQVGTTDIKARAEKVASAVPGVVRINNDLQVSPDSASTH